MFRFNTKLLLNSRIIWIWPVAAIVIAFIVGYYGDIQSAGNSYSFLLTFSNSPPFPSGLFIPGLIGFFILIAVIAVPSHLNKNLEPERAALIFSKSITRSDFFFSEFASVMAVVVGFTLFTDIALAVLLFAEAGIFPLQLYLAVLLFLPLYFFVTYVSIVLLLILTRSYLASVLIGYLVVPFISAVLLRLEFFFNLLGWNSDFLLGLADVLSYFIPSSQGVEALMSDFEAGGSVEINVDNGSVGEAFYSVTSGVFLDGFAAFDWQLFGFVLVSCLPFFLLSYYLMTRKEF